VSGMQDDPHGRQGDLRARLDRFLRTDPRDVGCDVTVEMLDVYAESAAAGRDAGERFPGVHAHVLACGPCAQGLEGLLALLTPGPLTPSDRIGWKHLD
jgi:hypothetical protein